MSSAEQEEVASLSERRRASWLLGRAAVRGALLASGRPGETAGLVMPHPWLSLSHGARHAVAVAVRSHRGAGIDYEGARRPRPGSERFFLDVDERRWLSLLPEAQRSRAALRLWTVKEALFKANLDNAGTLVGHYHVEDPAAPSGRARWAGRRFRYASARARGGFVSVALPED